MRNAIEENSRPTDMISGSGSPRPFGAVSAVPVAAAVLAAALCAHPGPLFAQAAPSVPETPRAAEIERRLGSDLPAPSTVSPAMRELLKMPPWELWKSEPATPEQWRAWLEEFEKAVPDVTDTYLKVYDVSLKEETVAGVPCFVLEPNRPDPYAAGWVLLHLRGGGYVMNAGRRSVKEAVPLAAALGCRVVCPDYRQLPEYPYPAPVDDCFAVYLDLVDRYGAQSVGVFGSSAGGALALAIPQRARKAGVPMPGAVMAGTPWADLTAAGDTIVTNEGTDTSLVSVDGILRAAARAYAPEDQWTNPEISPIHADFTGFPPTLLVSGTRDLFLSDTARVQAAMLKAGVTVELIVHEGLPHCFQYALPGGEETNYHYFQVARFFRSHLR